MKYYFSLIGLAFILSGCSDPDAQNIVDKSISFYNMEKLRNATLEFDFRNIRYLVSQQEGKFKYERIFKDSTGDVHDILSNEGFKRLLNGKEINLDTAQSNKYKQSVNAVIYFTYLPLKLNDPSVIKRYLGERRIKGKTYHKLEISFDQASGGKDHSDVYYYWFDTKDFSMDHFAYSAGGNRFREVLRSHEVGGVIFQDYINYQSPAGDSTTSVLKYDSLYEVGKLRELSRIEIRNIVLK